MIPKTDDFIVGLRKMFVACKKNVDLDGEFVDISASDLHHYVGYDRRNQRYPTCCTVMKGAMRGKDKVIYEPKGRKSSAVVIRYRFPRII